MVSKIAACPVLVIPMKACGAAAARSASTATRIEPSVPFLKPTGHESPEASWRCVCDSVVRAPIAPHAIKSEMYCGESRSRNSVPQGRPRRLISSRSFLAWRKPSLIAKLPSRRGSLMKPFQPTVVRGFSKYTRITRKRSAAWREAASCSRRA